MKHCRSAVSAVVVLIALLVSSVPALADNLMGPTTCQKYDTGTTVCSASGHGSASTPTIKIHDVQQVSHKGKTEVESWVTHIGLPHYPGYTNHKNYTYVGHHPPAKWHKGMKKVIEVAAGTKGTNSYTNRDGGTVWFGAKVQPNVYVHGKLKYAWQFFFWNTARGVWQNVVCHNKWLFGGHPHLVSPKTFVVVKAWSKLKYTFSWNDMAFGMGQASAYCLITQNGITVMASSSAGYGFNVSDKGYVSVYAYSYASAKYLAGQKSSSIKLTTESNAAHTTLITASGHATADAKCSISQTTPQPVPPTCESVYGPGYTEMPGQTFPNCVKDGSTTPPPPPSAPGPNPTDPPPGAPGGSGSFPCWDTATGQHGVDYLPGTTTCPPGYFG